MSALPDPLHDPRAVRVVKRPMPVAVTFATAAGCCQTLEGAVEFRAGDAVLTGVRGEQWPVERERFLAGYVAQQPTQPGENGRYVKRPERVLALRLEHAVSVPVGWRGDPLTGKPGDWLLAYADGSRSVVQDDIFRETYIPLSP